MFYVPCISFKFAFKEWQFIKITNELIFLNIGKKSLLLFLDSS